MQNIILPILLGAMGWLFTNAIEDFSNERIISYHINEYNSSERNTEVILRNISPTRQSTNFQLGLACRDTSECFENRSGQFFGLNRHQPHFVEIIKDNDLTSEDMLYMDIQMPFGSEIRIISFHPESFDLNEYDIFLILRDHIDNGQLFIEDSSYLRPIIEHRITIYLSLLLSIIVIIAISPLINYLRIHKAPTG